MEVSYLILTEGGDRGDRMKLTIGNALKRCARSEMTILKDMKWCYGGWAATNRGFTCCMGKRSKKSSQCIA